MMSAGRKSFKYARYFSSSTFFLVLNWNGTYVDRQLLCVLCCVLPCSLSARLLFYLSSKVAAPLIENGEEPSVAEDADATTMAILLIHVCAWLRRSEWNVNQITDIR
jgi:hypothetical protein